MPYHDCGMHQAPWGSTHWVMKHVAGAATRMRRVRDWPIGVRLIGGIGTVLVLLGVLAVVASLGGQRQTRAAKNLEHAQQLTRVAMQAKFRAADFNGWQTAYAFDAVRLGPRAVADGASSRKAFLGSAAAFRVELA